MLRLGDVGALIAGIEKFNEFVLTGDISVSVHWYRRVNNVHGCDRSQHAGVVHSHICQTLVHTISHDVLVTVGVYRG